MAYLCLIVFMCLIPIISSDEYLIGYLPNVKGRENVQRRGNVISGAITYAVDVINKSNLLNKRLAVIYNDTKGDTLLGTNSIIHQWSKGAIAFFGPEDSCNVEATVASSLNLPIISHKCRDVVRSEKNHYKTFFRTHPPPTRVVKSIIALLKYYRWTKFTVLVENDHSFLTIANSLEKQAIANNFTPKKIVLEDVLICCEDRKPCCEKKFKNAIEETYKTTRVYIFVGNINDIYSLLRELQMKNLLKHGEYVVIYIDLEVYRKAASYNYFWVPHEMIEDEKNSAVIAAQSLLVLVATSPDPEEYSDFQNNVLAFNQKDPFNFPENFHNTTLPFSAFSLYDAVMLYSQALAEVLEENADPKNGTYIIEKIIARKEYRSVSGLMMHIDENGDVEGNYTVLSRHKTAKSTIFAEINTVIDYLMLPVGRFHYPPNSSEPEFRLEREIDWINGKPPLEEPVCNFDGSLCKTLPNKSREIIAGVLACLLISISLVVSILYRNWKYEQEIAGLLWKISLNEIQRTNSEGNISSTSKASLSQMSMDSRVNNQMFTQTAFYRGMWVAIKSFHFSKKNMDISRKMKKEMKVMRELHCNNINPFVGACIQPNCIYVVTEYCTKGSLQDILENDDLKLDKMFIASLVSDLIKGMIFLHDSELKVHGNLKSSNCLVTSRWILQVADFGLHELRSIVNNTDTTEHEQFRNLFWKAPELIRPNSPFPNVSQKGDVYSFGIILHEIIRRQGPYGNNPLSPKEIIKKVIKDPLPKEELFRPSIVGIDCQDYIVHTMQECWAEKPEVRPDFITIKEKLKKMRQGMKSNIVDNMMDMMEKYANNLEEIVNERTCLLVEEQKKTESLLHRMLPKSVATQLIKGEVVVPESFDAVTIYFSDIVGFTEMSAVSTPMEVVTFLNDLYTIFDAIISHYDVYKVETIGDAYMVVSGLPIRNGDNHASEIASMALELLEAVKIFKIRHRPHQLLKLRIGIHTGPVVAGVVGLTMPRYCLFGDTVNTASRMESHGEALKIHISLQCKQYLQKLGGYMTEERGLVKMKGKGEVTTYWLLGYNTDKQHKILPHDLVLPQPLFTAMRDTEIKKRSPKLNNAHWGSLMLRTDKHNLEDMVPSTSFNSTSLCLCNSSQNSPYSGRICCTKISQETKFQDIEEQNEEIKRMTNGIKKTSIDDSATAIPLLSLPNITIGYHESRKSRYKFPRKSKCSLNEIQKNKSRFTAWFTRLFEYRLEEYGRQRISNNLDNTV